MSVREPEIELGAHKIVAKQLRDRVAERQAEYKETRPIGVAPEAFAATTVAFRELANWTRSWIPPDEIPTLQAKLAALAQAYGQLQAAQLKVEGVALKRLQLAHETTLAAAKLQRVEETIPSLERLVALERRPAQPQYVPPETNRLLDVVEALAKREVNIELPPPADVRLTIEKGAIAINQPPPANDVDWANQFEDGATYRFSKDEDGNREFTQLPSVREAGADMPS